MTACRWWRLSRQEATRPRQPQETDAHRSSGLHRLIEPPVLFPLLTVLVLLVIWAGTLNLNSRERHQADRAAVALTSDLSDTYEAQVVRALREIDNALRVVGYTLESLQAEDALESLRDRNLLLPEFIFSTAVADPNGMLLAGEFPGAQEDLAGRDFFIRARAEDEMVVSQAWRDEPTGDWLLTFSRQTDPDEAGQTRVVMISVATEYFVSTYDSRVMGTQGVIGIVGQDGVFRARRTGDDVSAGRGIDFDAEVPEDAPVDALPRVEVNEWDGVERYVIMRRLFQFPLATVVGLSTVEQMEVAEQAVRVNLARAGIASVVVVGLMLLLGRLSWQLQQARARMMADRIEHAREVEYLAFHDALTDLPNRAFFSRLLTQSMHQARRYERRLAVLFLDLDRFKIINDSLGHDAGDELLQEIARRLTETVRGSDVVARLGGDEFVVLLPELQDSSQGAPVADKILDAVGTPFVIAGHEFRITVSIGIAVFPEDGEDEQSLMKNADTAMYHAKQQGKNNYQFFTQDLSTDSLERLALESSMRTALLHGQFRLHYQAKKDLSTGKVTGMEALLRWEHPELGLVMPMQFIPLAEENGMIVPIGRWVMREACRQNVEWQKAGLPALSMAVNLSARQFLDEQLVDDVRQALHESGMEPGLLEVEITESMVMQDMARTSEILDELKSMGVHIAIDDFGTGYSSLSTLKSFPLDTIKIDRSFIQDIAADRADNHLTDAVIAVGKSLGLNVIAEGVETQAQADYLQAHSCKHFQGFYINRPMPAEEFARILRDEIENP